MPTGFADIDALEERLSRPDDSVVADLASLDGDIMVLGATGKIGPSLARMAKRAAPHKQVIAVARFSDPSLLDQFKQQGIETIQCDLLDPRAVAALPAIKNVILMTGYKFGATGNPARTWAVNTLLPAQVAATLKDRAAEAQAQAEAEARAAPAAGQRPRCRRLCPLHGTRPRPAKIRRTT